MFRTYSSVLEWAILCAKRLSNAQGGGFCEANGGYAPRGVIFRGRDGRGISSIDQIGAVP